MTRLTHHHRRSPQHAEDDRRALLVAVGVPPAGQRRKPELHAERVAHARAAPCTPAQEKMAPARLKKAKRSEAAARTKKGKQAATQPVRWRRSRLSLPN